MNPEFRRMMTAIVASLAVFFLYRMLVLKFFPPPPMPPATVESAPQPTGPGVAPGATEPAPATTATTPTAPATMRTLSLVSAEAVAPVTLGGRDGDALRLELDPRGASVARLELFRRTEKGRFVHRQRPDVDEPYALLSPIDDGERLHHSFATCRVWIKEYGPQSWPLDALPWKCVDQSSEHAVFTTVLTDSVGGGEALRLTKTYRLRAGQPVFDLELAVENVGTAPLTVWVDQDGPLNVPAEGQYYENRRLLVAQEHKGTIELNRAYEHPKLLEATRRGEPIPLLVPEKGRFAWTALANKYFGVFTRPVLSPDAPKGFVAGVTGLVSAPTRTEDGGDMLARITTTATTLGPASAVRFPFEVYAGPKDAGYLAKVNPDYVDRTKAYYQLAHYADQRCACTFGWLQDLMVWLLETIHRLVRNYGVAIMVLVLIVRGLLHPLSVWQQKSMFRMQEVMARLQPKLNEIKEKYANDRVRQNQEMIRLFSEEGVNPAANFVSFIPLFIQMPILVALWTALNTDVNLRHAPFDGWWIRDLSAPDALLTFEPPLTVPILSAIPLLGSVFTNISSLNLLPILMGVSMWLQQRYMPKPAMQARLEAARKHAAEGKKPGGPSPEDQLRQQMIMGYVMAILFPLMFYKMPSGLNLYWMATNVVGICESLIIRRQIEEEKKKRALEGPRPPKRPGLVSSFLKRIAAQAEELQRKADELSKLDESRKRDKRRP